MQKFSGLSFSVLRNIKLYLNYSFSQNQERIAKQIASAVVDAIRPSGVGVIVEGCHMCMSMRGILYISLE